MTYLSFWELCPWAPTGALPLEPAGGLRSPRPTDPNPPQTKLPCAAYGPIYRMVGIQSFQHSARPMFNLRSSFCLLAFSSPQYSLPYALKYNGFLITSFFRCLQHLTPLIPLLQLVTLLRNTKPFLW